MISLLVNELPETVSINGTEVSIDTDFRTGILFSKLMQDPGITDTVRVNTAIEMYYGSVNVPDRAAAINAILWFYSCGKYDPDKPKDPDEKPAKKQKQIFDYDHDAMLIFAAMLDQYRTDLQEVEHLHWWKFCAMQAGLKSDSEFVRVTGYRAMDLNQIKNREMRSRYAKLKSLYALPDNRTQEEKISDAGTAFAQGLWKHENTRSKNPTG